MKATVFPSLIDGTVLAASSKSTMQRACALALLNNGITHLKNPGKSNDDLVALEIIRKLGASVEKNAAGDLLITSKGVIQSSASVHCGESGLSVRMFTPIVALSRAEVVVSGEGSLLQRPIRFFDEISSLLNIKIKTTKGFLPLTIQGPLIPTSITIDGSLSSQYLTGLLFAFAKAATKEIEISVQNLKSKPYVDLSLQMMRLFGYVVSHDGYATFNINPAQEKIREIEYFNEGDWSGAAFLLVAGAIAGNVNIKGLQQDSVQADKAIVEVLKNCGASISLSSENLIVSRVASLQPFQFDATDCPDLFPPLAALAAYCDGISIIKGTSRLVAKESNRAVSLQDVFTKMGVDISISGEEMRIVGGKKIKTAIVHAHHDHRIVMASAIAALGAEGSISIEGAEAVEKSYPDFFNHLQVLGASVSLC